MKDNPQKPSKSKHDQKVQGFTRLKTTLNHEEGTKILRNLGKTVAAATIGDYLVDLDLWTISSLSNRLFNNKNNHVEFF